MRKTDRALNVIELISGKESGGVGTKTQLEGFAFDVLQGQQSTTVMITTCQVFLQALQMYQLN